MANQALTVDATVANTVTSVTSALATSVKAFLADDFVADAVVRFQATAAGSIYVCNADGALIGTVPSECSAVAVLRDSGAWDFRLLVSAPAAFVVDGSDAATTQTLANACKAALIAQGFMLAEAAA